ncbi:hypothetical protein [Streptomyces lavenduligriseus]|uniref:Uncharacterized protein n=1 Tax=Streptomyces lavenduligriseus TaxID=67315 RepID=A0ABT0P5U8_9ACTN|nr:hypothetical protein [Streptomyces lavenduligriseus]MCL3999110.1 hypothetical protein [Streptomyces lavenduligriseus]
MGETHDHRESQAVARALRAVLPAPSRTCVYVLACGCPDAEGLLSWHIDTESRSYELELSPAATGPREVRLTSRPLIGDEPAWSEEFLIGGAPASWTHSLARLVARLTLSDRSPLSLG